MMPTARLKDVAAIAGVSIKTVSNVVHDRPCVRPATRDRVRAAIAELGYRPNASARRLVTGRTGMIALALPEINVPYFAELSRHLADLAAARGYRVLFEQTITGVDVERTVVSGVEAGLVDGVLYHPVALTTREVAELRQHLPFVLVGEGAAPLGMDHVMIDNVAAARDAVRHLLRLGRTRIAFLGHETRSPTNTTRRRLMGYQLALEENGIAPDSDLVLAIDSFGRTRGSA